MSDASALAAVMTSAASSKESASQKAKIAKDMQALAQALEKNDTKAAQKAMEQLNLDSPPASSSGGQGSNVLSKVTSALQSGDISTAKKEFADFESAASTAFAARNADPADTSS